MAERNITKLFFCIMNIVLYAKKKIGELSSSHFRDPGTVSSHIVIRLASFIGFCMQSMTGRDTFCCICVNKNDELKNDCMSYLEPYAAF